MFFRKIIFKYSDSRIKGSWSHKQRLKRFKLFKNFISHLNEVSILDIGGTENFWERMNYLQTPNTRITLLNLTKQKTNNPNICSLIGDGRNMKNFVDKSFDVVFSNSVIEHVGDLNDQRNMANEVKRIGRYYFLQTPNYYFPLEPHFLFIGFQWLPIKFRAFLVRNFNMGWHQKTGSYGESINIVKGVRLLKEYELRKLFPDAEIVKEKFCFLTKSFIVYGKNVV